MEIYAGWCATATFTKCSIVFKVVLFYQCSVEPNQSHIYSCTALSPTVHFLHFINQIHFYKRNILLTEQSDFQITKPFAMCMTFNCKVFSCTAYITLLFYQIELKTMV